MLHTHEAVILSYVSIDLPGCRRCYVYPPILLIGPLIQSFIAESLYLLLHLASE